MPDAPKSTRYYMFDVEQCSEQANHACGVEVSLRLFRHHIRLAETVAELVRKDARFELSAPPRFGLVCFHLKVRPSPHAHIPAQPSHGIQHTADTGAPHA